MKAVLLMNHGGPEMLPYGEAPDPTAGPGEILVGAAGMAQSYMDRGPYEIRTADQLVFQKRCLRSSLAGSPRRCRLRHCPTTSGVTPDEFVSAVDITGELSPRLPRPTYRSVNQVMPQDQLQERLAVNKSFAEGTPRSAAILNHLHAVILSCLIPGPPFK